MGKSIVVYPDEGVSCMSCAIGGKLVRYRTNCRCGLPYKQRMINNSSLVFREDS
jgi:hypothetical protein